MNRYGKCPCPMAVGTEAKHNYHSYYSRKMKEKQDMREFVKELVGSLICTALLGLIVVLMLLVG